MREIIVETERLVLRCWEPGDLAHWLRHLNVPPVTDHLRGVQAHADVVQKFEAQRQSWDENGFSFLPVALKPCGTFLGACGLGRIESEAAPIALRGQIQIGWQLRADQWGKGYATEAARAVVGLAFGPCGITTLYAQTALRNRASWAIMEKLGMRRRSDLDYVDADYSPADNPTILYALDRTDWAVMAGS
jgi:RimJ/RimL family protein N-acetyltransferase